MPVSAETFLAVGTISSRKDCWLGVRVGGVPATALRGGDGAPVVLAAGAGLGVGEDSACVCGELYTEGVGVGTGAGVGRGAGAGVETGAGAGCGAIDQSSRVGGGAAGIGLLSRCVGS